MSGDLDLDPDLDLELELSLELDPQSEPQATASNRSNRIVNTARPCVADLSSVA